MPKVVVVGSINMDLVVRVHRMPQPGETIIGRDLQAIPGGKGANQAVGAARMGADVVMIGCVGEDSFGDTLIANLKAEQIETSFIQRLSGTASGIAMITLDEQGQNSIVVASGANMRLSPEMIRSAWPSLGPIDVVVLQHEVPLDCNKEAVRLAKRNGAKVILNPAPAFALPDDFLNQVDFLVPNETETALLTGMEIQKEEHARQALYHLLELGLGAVILTLGDKGAMMAMAGDETEAQLFPSYQVNVVDTTAAGDAFVAALAVGIGEGSDIESATRMANAAGAMAVTKMGAQPSMPTRVEVLTLMNKERGG